MNKYRLEISSDKNQLAIKASGIISNYISEIINQNSRVKICLSGGTSPSSTYRLLADKKLQWSNVDIFLGDERWVDPDDEKSNSLMLKKTLIGNKLTGQANFYPVPIRGCKSSSESAEKFSTLMQKICGSPPIFDLVLLGLGDDGHTASLFPYSEQLTINDKFAISSFGAGMDRITLTTPVLSSAKKVIFLVSGSNKQTALRRLLDENESASRTPARLIQSKNEVLILADNEAACSLESHNV